ncbi:MAG: 3,4-dihydroxy-2-butanone-4-phosphate synthase [candidate division WOR-3 bacterium]
MKEKIFSSVEEVIQDLREGRPIIVVDDEDRENEGDFVVAAEKATPEIINLMARAGGGLVCIALNPARFDELDLNLPVPNTSRMGTPFGIPIDASEVTTGTSAHERAMTARWAADETRGPEDFLRPGHLYTLRASEGGVLRRAGHTEAGVDLARLAGLYPAAVICEIMDEDGSMARLPRLSEIAKAHGLRIITVDEIIRFRLAREIYVERLLVRPVKTRWGDFVLYLYKDKIKGDVHLALVSGRIEGNILVRVQRECPVGDVFGSVTCDCREQMDAALFRIGEEGGIFVYLRQEPSSSGTVARILEHVDPDYLSKERDEAERYIGTGAQILKDLGVSSMRLLTNNPRKMVGIEGFGLTITERVPIQPRPRRENLEHLLKKRDDLGHIIGPLDQPEEI